MPNSLEKYGVERGKVMYKESCPLPEMSPLFCVVKLDGSEDGSSFL